jgi:branched-chain amino acid transport system substrate-binding protein
MTCCTGDRRLRAFWVFPCKLPCLADNPNSPSPGWRGLPRGNKGINPNLLAVGGYDGMHLIYEVLKKTGGKVDADAFVGTAKGMKWKSPRGRIEIDPETRDIVQTIYIRRVEKVGGELQNVEFDRIDAVKDPGR